MSGGSSSSDVESGTRAASSSAISPYTPYIDSDSEKCEVRPSNSPRTSSKMARFVKPLSQLPYRASGVTTPTSARVPPSASSLQSLFAPLSLEPLSQQSSARKGGAAVTNPLHAYRDEDIDDLIDPDVILRPHRAAGVPSEPPFTKAWLLRKISNTLPNKELTYASVGRAFFGSLLVSLINLVGNLAMASAVGTALSPGDQSFKINGVSILVPLVMLCTNGLLTAGLYLVGTLNGTFSATSPTCDAFLTPFYVKLALACRDAQRGEGDGQEDDFVVFLSTFTLCISIGLFLSGVMCVLATRVKIFNFGEYVPYPVICGLLSSIGCFLWLVSFSIDADRSVYSIFSGSASPRDAFMAILHHLPSSGGAFIIFWFGDKNVNVLPLTLLGLTLGGYIMIGITGSTLHSASENGWFWAADLFVYDRSSGVVNLLSVPEPFHHLEALFLTLAGKGNFINWTAVKDSFQIILSMVFVYTLRMTLHVTAVVSPTPNPTRSSPRTARKMLTPPHPAQPQPQSLRRSSHSTRRSERKTCRSSQTPISSCELTASHT